MPEKRHPPRPAKFETPKAEREAAARALYEGQPGSSSETVAADVGVSVSTVRRWKARGKWVQAVNRLPSMSARAAELADKFKVKMSELGKPLTDEVAASEAAREVAADYAIDIRSEVLSRHRKEWAAPRKVAYEALQQAGKGDVSGGFERAKLAKITAETLTLVQVGECRAYGINHESRAADDRTVVVLERGSSVPESPAVSPSPGTETTGDEF